jgi:hypothetical protein
MNAGTRAALVLVERCDGVVVQLAVPTGPTTDPDDDPPAAAARAA